LIPSRLGWEKFCQKTRFEPTTLSKRTASKVKVKVKFTLEQAMKAQRESRGTAVLFL
jgi:hypothetical protein